MSDPHGTTTTGTALRVKATQRHWIIGAGLVLTSSWLVFGHERPAATIALVSVGLVIGSAVIAAMLRRDRCSACRAPLPLQVLDERCPSCDRAITGVDDDGKHTDLPERARRLPPSAAGKDAVPYRASSAAALDAEDAALDQAGRTDVGAIRRRLLADPKIKKALEDKDEATLYRLVRERRKKAKSLSEDAALDALINDPRRHLDPKKRPFLGVRAGSGFALSLPHDLDRSDGSFLAEQLLVVGTYPIAPVAAYALRRPATGGLTVLGRVPLPFMMRVWRAVVALPFAALLAGGAVSFVGSLSSKVHLINALDVPVNVSIDGEVVRVAIEGREIHAISRGKHHLITRDDRGTIIEEQDLSVPGGDALVAYNVLGAAPLVAREIAYSALGDGPGDLRGELLLGRRVLIRENVTYPFVDAPEHIPGGGPDVRTWQVTLLPGGWHGTLRALSTDYPTLDSAPLVEAVALAEPENEEAVRAAVDRLAARDGKEGARAFLTRLAARAPGSAAVRAAEERLRAP